MQLLGARYRLARRLGTGGMSVVWRGYDELLGRLVAVKMLAETFAANEAFRGRVRHEALAAARLCHPHVACVYDFGETAGPDGTPLPYLVMELVEGPSLAACLVEGPLPWQQALRLVAELAEALCAVHELGVVHRDVTPSNVLLSPTGAKLVDFGISAPAGSKESTGTVLGTPAYLAPERLTGAPVQPATDVYALGVVMYQALTGVLPWSGETTAQVLAQHRFARPAALPDIPGLPEGVAELCLRCLGKRPEDRPRAAELAEELSRRLGLRRLAMPVPVLSTATGELPVVGTGDVADGAREADVPKDAGVPAGVPKDRWAMPEPAAAADPAPAPIPAPVPGPDALPTTIGTPLERLLQAAADDVGAPDEGTGAPANRAEPAPVEAVLAEPPPAEADAEVPPRRARWPYALLPVGVGLIVLGLLQLATGLIPMPGGRTPGAAAAGPPGSGVPAACAVAYHVRSAWGAGFTADVRVTNTGSAPLRTWTLTFRFPGDQRVVQGWNGSFQQSGSVVSVHDAGYNGMLAPAGTTTLGFNGAYRSGNAAPGTFALNGTGCTVRVQ